MEAREHLSVLVHMSVHKRQELIKRKQYLYELGISKGMTKNTIDYLIDYPDPLSDVTKLCEDDKFACLYTAVQFMKYDRKIRPKEVRFCRYLAACMGYSTQIIYELSMYIYSEPTMSVRQEVLQKQLAPITP